MCCRDAGVRQRAPLGARDCEARAHRADDWRALREPFVKPQTNDAADSEALCEAGLRPSVRFFSRED